MGTKIEHDQLGETLEAYSSEECLQTRPGRKSLSPRVGRLGLGSECDSRWILFPLWASVSLSDEGREDENPLSLPALLLWIPGLCEDVLNECRVHVPRHELGAWFGWDVHGVLGTSPPRRMGRGLQAGGIWALLAGAVWEGPQDSNPVSVLQVCGHHPLHHTVSPWAGESPLNCT